MENRNQRENELILIPKSENYVEYMLNVILKIPRTEKFSIGTEYKQSMYRLLRQVIYLSKVDVRERFETINKIDAELTIQRIFLRIMYKGTWIDKKKFDVAMGQIYEMGKIVGGLVKYYGKNNQKRI